MHHHKARKISDEENSSTQQQQRLVNSLFKYQTWLMRLFGQYHCSSDHWCVKLHHFLIVVIHWICFVKIFVVFDFTRGKSEVFNANLVFKMIIFVWLFYVASHSTILFIIQEKRDKIDKLNRLYEEIVEQYESSNKVSEIKRAILIITLIGFTFSSVNSIANIAALFGPDEFFITCQPLTAPFQNEAWARESVPYRLLTSLTLLLGNAAWYLPISYYISYCYLSFKLLDHFNASVKQFSVTGVLSGDVQHQSEAGLNELRKWYLKIELFIKQIDSCFHAFIGIAIVAYVPNAFLILYIISDWSGNCVVGLFEVMFPLWLFYCAFAIVVIVESAAMINKKVQESLEHIMHISTESYSTDGRIEKNILICNLMHNKVGLTVFGYFIIEKPFIITVLSTILGYFIMMTSFKSSKVTSCL